MPKYRVAGTYKFVHRIIQEGDEELKIDAIVEADDEKTALDSAIDDAMEYFSPDTFSYEEIETEVVSDTTSDLTITPIDESDPEYQKRQNEATMRALGPQVAPILLEVE